MPVAELVSLAASSFPDGARLEAIAGRSIGINYGASTRRLVLPDARRLMGAAAYLR